MICTQCKHRNGIGNKFCRECGTPLPLPESPLAIEEGERAGRERLTERVSGLLAAAYTLAEQKRYDQSLPLAEEAVLLLPDSTAALSLLATLYEYSGQDEKAIRTMERVVALNPESPGDRQKLGHLRQAFAQAQSDEPFPLRGAAATAGRAAASPAGNATARPLGGGLVGLSMRRRPYLRYVLGGAAAACVLGVGLSVTHGRGGATGGNPTGNVNVERGNLGGAGATSAELAARALTGSSNPSTSAAQVPPSAPTTIPTYAAGADPFVSHAGNAGNGGNGGGNVNNGGGYSTYIPPRVASGNRYRNYGGYSNGGGGNVSLPSFRQVNSSGGGDNGDSSSTQPIAPIIAVAPGAGNNAGNGGSPSPYGATESNPNPVRIAAGPPPTTGAGGGGGGASSGSNQGYISITVGPPGSHASGAGSSGSSSSSESATGSHASSGGGGGGSSLAQARNLQATGRYADAIAAYRAAIGGDGGASGSAWQGIAQCEESLHDRAAARSAYQNALHAYQSQLSAGRNSGAARRGIDSCNAALEAIGD